MPQEFQALQCYNCKIFQVEIVKKIPKWECKICHEKQSVKQIFLKGTSKDCRLFIQGTNEALLTLETDRTNSESRGSFLKALDVNAQLINQTYPGENNLSKWEQFLENKATHENGDDENSQFTFVRPEKRKRDNRRRNTKKVKSVNTDKDSEFEPNTDSCNDLSANLGSHRKFLVEPKEVLPEVHKSNDRTEVRNKWSSYLEDECIDDLVTLEEGNCVIKSHTKQDRSENKNMSSKNTGSIGKSCVAKKANEQEIKTNNLFEDNLDEHDMNSVFNL